MSWRGVATGVSAGVVVVGTAGGLVAISALKATKPAVKAIPRAAPKVPRVATSYESRGPKIGRNFGALGNRAVDAGSYAVDWLEFCSEFAEPKYKARFRRALRAYRRSGAPVLLPPQISIIKRKTYKLRPKDCVP